MQGAETWLSWLKYGRSSKFTGVQHLDIFEVLIEVATTIEETIATIEQRVIAAM
jgi:hypothetical protein